MLIIYQDILGTFFYCTYSYQPNSVCYFVKCYNNETHKYHYFCFVFTEAWIDRSPTGTSAEKGDKQKSKFDFNHVKY